MLYYDYMSESCVRGISRSIKTLQRGARTPAMSGIIVFVAIVFAFMTYSTYAADDDPTNATEYPAWDIDQNSVVDVSDLLFVTQHLGETVDISLHPNPDVNHDGKADILDLILVSNHYGEDYQGNIYARITQPEVRAIPQYSKFEARIETNIRYDNPFSPEEVDLKVHFLTPAGREHVMPAFYDEEDGQPVWKVRYAPMELGSYRYYVVLGETKKTAEQTFDCVPSDSDGFIRVSPDDYRYFQFDSGKPYFAIGHAVGWADDDGYEYYFRKMAAHGENHTHIRMLFWNVEIEWSDGVVIEWLDAEWLNSVARGYPGLGRYHLGKAERIDNILELAEEYGIYITIAIEDFVELRISEPWPLYQGNPYAKGNGGMLEKPEQFFTHPEAKRLFKQRLRYLVARYAYHPHIFCWQLWNEVDAIEKYISEDVTVWHQEMARYLRQIDPMEHLISTSFADTAGDSAIWQLPEMEWTQSHQYSSQDMAASIRYWAQHNISKFEKPHIFGEYGIDARGPSGESDPDGINLHNGIWAAVLSGSAGTAMPWYWESYIDPYDLYYHFQPLAQFVEDMDWPRSNFRDAAIGEVHYIDPQFRNLELYSTDEWGYQPTVPYCILRDGTVEGEAQIAKYLYAPWSPMYIAQTFLVDYPGDGSFEVHIDEVPSHGRLQIHLDGELVLDQELPTWPEDGFGEKLPLFWEKGENRIPNSGFEADNLGSDPSGWTLEDGDDAEYRWEIDNKAHSGRRSLKVIGDKATGTFWHTKVKVENMSMEAGKNFTIAFWAKVDANEGESREVSTNVQMQHDPWIFYGGNHIFLDSTDWKEYFSTFTATADVVEDMWVGLAIGQSDVDFWIDDFRFFEGEPMDEMTPGDLVYSIHVPAGEHTIMVDNQGEDWISIDYYRLTNFHTREKKPPLRVLGLQNDTEAMLWLQNSEHIWYKMSMGMPLQTIPPVFVEVQGLQDGKYQIEWWNTYRPDSVESAEAVSTSGVLQLETPEITRDIACKVRLR